MASIYQNEKTKKWEFVFDHYENGKRKQIRRRGFKTKREANEEMTQLQNELKEGEFVNKNNYTISSFMKYWLENVRKLECDECTFYNNNLYYKNHIKPRIGAIKLQSLNIQDCQKFVNDMHEEGYARNTIDRVCTLIKQCLDAAMMYKYVKQNNMRGVTLPRRQKMNMKVWTIEQANYFLNFTKNKRYHCVYALALLAGMRQGEILGLRWSDIDFDKKTITVYQTLTHYGKSLKIGTKTSAGDRTISIPSQLVAILIKQREQYQKLKDELGSNFIDIDIVIFNLKNGGTIFPSNLTKQYIKDVEKSGLFHIRFHDLRHTHATMLIARNTNVKVISERLGHSKIGVTLDVYSHVLPSMQQEVVKDLEEIINL